MKKEYYYLEDSTGSYVVTDIAKGGSRAGRITGYDKKEKVAPLLFNYAEDAEDLVKKDGEGDFSWKEPGKKKTTIHITWKIKSVEVEL